MEHLGSVELEVFRFQRLLFFSTGKICCFVEVFEFFLSMKLQRFNVKYLLLASLNLIDGSDSVLRHFLLILSSVGGVLFGVERRSFLFCSIWVAFVKCVCRTRTADFLFCTFCLLVEIVDLCCFFLVCAPNSFLFFLPFHKNLLSFQFI